jgi:hypothetical protein
VVWYSALVLDVARLLRWGDRRQAAVVLEAANELMAGRAAAFVAESLGEVHPEAGGDLAEMDEATGGALSRLALLTEGMRRRAPIGERLRSEFGTIIDVTESYATTVTEDGVKLALPMPSGEDRVWSTVGAVVAVDYEISEGLSMLTWVRPALALSMSEGGRTPVEPVLLNAEERTRLLADDVLSAG